VPGGDRAEIKQKDPTKKGWGVLGQRTAENCKKSFGRYLAKPALKNPKGRGIFERKEPSGSENQH
jgi:hypothetical protein